jgi:ribosomal protein S4
VYFLQLNYKQKREKRKSKFGKNLINRQKFRKYYATLKYYQMKNFYIKSIKKTQNENINGLIRFTSIIEKRLGSIVYRMNFCKTIQEGHQRIRTGYYLVNGKEITYPNYIVKLGDIISVNPVYKNNIRIEFEELLKKNLLVFTYPKYMLVDYKSFAGMVIRDPLPKEVPYFGNIDLKVIYLAFKNKYL